MLFSCDYTSKDIEQRPYLLAIHYLTLFDQDGEPLRRVWTFDTETMIGHLKDGSPIQVHSYGWYPPTEKDRDRILRLIPESLHHLVVVTAYESRAYTPDDKDYALDC